MKEYLRLSWWRQIARLSPRCRAFLWALLGMCLFAGSQALTVAKNYHGNWTALFCTGQLQINPVPADLVRGTWIFPRSRGYDGQMYRYVAHDPWWSGIDHLALDDSAMRQRRILIPAVAWLLALGRSQWIDSAYLVVLWSFVFAGCYWASRWAAMQGFNTAWGLLYLLVPSTLIAADRVTIDIATSSLTIGMVVYSRQHQYRKLFAAALLVCLSRETGLLVVAAFVIGFLFESRRTIALILSTAAIPTFAWYGLVWLHQLHSTVRIMPAWVGKGSHTGIVFRLFHPLGYPLPSKLELVTQALDILALLGMILAFLLAFAYWWRNKTAVPQLTALLFTLLLPLVSSAKFWDSVYGYSRPFSPLLVVLPLCALRHKYIWLGLAPIGLILPRIVLQLGPQAAGLFGLHLT